MFEYKITRENITFFYEIESIVCELFKKRISVRKFNNLKNKPDNN
jgi:hypothetical protein